MLDELRCDCGSRLKIKVSETKGTYAYCSFCEKEFPITQPQSSSTPQEKTTNINISYTTRHIDEAKVLKVKSEQSKAFIKPILIIVSIIIALSLTFVFFNNIKSCYSEIEQEREQEIENAIAQGKISAGNYFNYLNDNFEAVIQELKLLGFTNINTIDLDDSFFDSEEVAEISIAGNNSFGENDYFNPNDLIIIKYH